MRSFSPHYHIINIIIIIIIIIIAECRGFAVNTYTILPCTLSSYLSLARISEFCRRRIDQSADMRLLFLRTETDVSD